jgi:cholest-4-en-3-one 26-monooxygenase
MTIDTSAVDIHSFDAYADGPDHELFRQLRDEAPVFRHEGKNPGEVPWFWAIMRHADIVAVSRQFQTYSAARKGVLMNEDRPDMELARMMIDTDPPEHTRLRTLVNRGFTPSAIKLMSDHYVDVTREIVAAAVDQPEVEFVSMVAAELPLVAIAEMLGVPVEDRRKVFDWSNQMVGANDPDYSAGPEGGQAAMTELYMYFNELAADRRANPRNDIVSILMAAEDGDQLTDHEFNLFTLLLSVAGSETTRNAISHGIQAFIEHPDQWQLLRSDPSLVDSAVEEILRWATPVNMFRRTATGPVELHGVTIGEDEPVVMFYPSGNRDERVFENPMTFDITRSPNPHITFGGGGPHFCLGSNLARLEMRALFAELADKVAVIEPTQPMRRMRSSFLNAIKSLHVSLTPA